MVFLTLHLESLHNLILVNFLLHVPVLFLFVYEFYFNTSITNLIVWFFSRWKKLCHISRLLNLTVTRLGHDNFSPLETVFPQKYDTKGIYQHRKDDMELGISLNLFLYFVLRSKVDVSFCHFMIALYLSFWISLWLCTCTNTHKQKRVVSLLD